MLDKRRDGTRSAILALGVALGGEWTVQAQGPGLSTGSGAGTGAGAGAMSSADTGAGGGMSGANTGAGGAMSGRGPGSSMDWGSALPLGPRRGTLPFGPGVDVSFPSDPYLVPFLLPVEVANPAQGNASTRIAHDQLKNARDIADPAERSLALRQLANGAIAGNQMVLAHHILEEAIISTSHVTVPLVRDQRLIGLVVSLTALADAQLRVGRESQGMTAPADEVEAAGLEPLPRRPESTVLIRMARLEWRRAVYLAKLIANPTYRNEMLYRIAEDESVGSSTIAVDFPIASAMESLGSRQPPARVPGAGPNPPAPGTPARLLPPAIPGRRVAPGQTPTTPANRPPAAPAPPAATPAVPAGDVNGKGESDFARLADEVLIDSWNVANEIDWLIWKNRVMVRIALSASDSRQFTRAVELARTIDNAEARCEALLLLAEAMCRPGQAAQPEAATAAYQATAEAVASIPQPGLRGVMVGFLIDSLISSGRFDDARACTVIYPEESDRFVALGAVAEAQGRRGLAESARRWIAEAPAAYRSALYRRVSTGVLWSIENQRSKEMDIDSTIPPPAAR